MKPIPPLCRRRCRALALAAFFLGLLLPQIPAADSPPGMMQEYQPAKGEFDAVGRAVLALLQTKNTAELATNLSVSAADWQSLASTNLSGEDADKLTAFAKGGSRNRQRLEAGAKSVLSRADSLHLDFSKGGWHFQIVAPRHVGRIYYSGRREEGLTLPHVAKLEMVVRTADGPTNGDFKLAVRGLEKFPTGWRIGEDLQWTGFPSNVVDEKTLRELALLEKVAAYKGFNGEEDPALLKFGGALVHFIRERDPRIFEKESLLNGDVVWAMFQQSGRQGLSRKEVEEEISQQNRQQVELAGKVLKQMDDAGIDLKMADIQIRQASIERGQSQGNTGSLDQLMGEQFKLALSVKTEGKAKNGTSLAGEYVLAVKTIVRFGEEWKVMNDVHWEKLPDGVMDARTAANIEFENYVAAHGTLPLQTAAPEIEFTTLTGGNKMKLADLRGKVVVLDFWATWCGPCQEPMADLQKLRQAHPDWRDQVAIVPLSIDDTIDIVRKHVDKRGWTNTFNVWAGDGGWRSAPATAFRVTGVPTTYLIDSHGEIVWAGHPSGMDLGASISRLLPK